MDNSVIDEGKKFMIESSKQDWLRSDEYVALERISEITVTMKHSGDRYIQRIIISDHLGTALQKVSEYLTALNEKDPVYFDGWTGDDNPPPSEAEKED